VAVLGILGTAEIVEDSCFSYRSVRPSSLRAEGVLTWVLSKGHCDCFNTKYSTHNYFASLLIDRHLLHRPQSSSVLRAVLTPRTDLIVRDGLSQILKKSQYVFVVLSVISGSLYQRSPVQQSQLSLDGLKVAGRNSETSLKRENGIPYQLAPAPLLRHVTGTCFKTCSQHS